MSPTGHVVEEDNLGVVIALNLLTSGAVSWHVHLGVHVDHFTVTLVSELNSFC